MKVVLDTNVFVSGVFFGGIPGRILEGWRDGAVTLLVSVPILDEYRRVGRLLTLEYEGVELEPILALVAVHADVVEARTCRSASASTLTTTSSLPARWLVAPAWSCPVTSIFDRCPAGMGLRF